MLSNFHKKIKLIKKSKMGTDRPTDQLTNWQTNRRTDKAGCRVHATRNESRSTNCDKKSSITDQEELSGSIYFQMRAFWRKTIILPKSNSVHFDNRQPLFIELLNPNRLAKINLLDLIISYLNQFFWI